MINNIIILCTCASDGFIHKNNCDSNQQNNLHVKTPALNTCGPEKENMKSHRKAGLCRRGDLDSALEKQVYRHGSPIGRKYSGGLAI